MCSLCNYITKRLPQKEDFMSPVSLEQLITKEKKKRIVLFNALLFKMVDLNGRASVLFLFVILSQSESQGLFYEVFTCSCV